MDYSQIIISQYLAALEMLKQTITKCPESIWNSPSDKTKFWHIAYHALFYTHLYLQNSEADFTPWAKHRDEYQFIGQLPWPPHSPPHIGEPYDKDRLLEYLRRRSPRECPSWTWKLPQVLTGCLLASWSCSSTPSATFNNTPGN
jgi:hypothetical protein